LKSSSIDVMQRLGAVIASGQYLENVLNTILKEQAIVQSKRRLRPAIASLSVALAASFWLVGCAGTSGSRGSDQPVTHSGFLSDYSKLSPVEGREGTQRYINRAANLRQYSKLYIDPVQIFVNTDAHKGVQPDAMKRITDSFYKAFSDAVTPGYRIVSAPGSDVLRVRLAITGVQAISPPLGVTDFIPIKAIYNAGRAAAGEAPRLVELTAEIEVLDGQNQIVASAVSTRKSDNTLAQKEQITWSELSPIVYTWARQFRQALDDVRGVAR
jgi:Protein of unknown function (DUF3313)